MHTHINFSFLIPPSLHSEECRTLPQAKAFPPSMFLSVIITAFKSFFHKCWFPYPVCTFTHYSTTYFLTLHYIFSYAILGEPSAIWIIPHFLNPFFMIRCCMTILSSCVSILRWLIFLLQNSTDILKIP